LIIYIAGIYKEEEGDKKRGRFRNPFEISVKYE